LERTDPQLQRQKCPYAAPFVVEMRNDRGPLKDVRVRQALSMAIDRESLGKVAWAGQFFPRYSPVHAGLGDWSLQLKEYPPETAKLITYNPAEAKRLMTEAGYANGFEVSVSYGPHLPGQTAIAEFLTSAWAQVGVKLNLKAYDRATFVRTSNVQRNAPEDMFLQFTSAATVYESLYHYFRCDLPRNLSRVCDPQVDRLIDQMVVTQDEKARRAVVNDLQKYLVQKQFRMELPQSVAAMITQPWVKNVYYRTDAWADADYVKFAWLDK
jgi:peptide/nickel transport system substrate-binding protein